MKYLGIAVVIIGQAIGIAVGCHDNPSPEGAIKGWLGSVLILLMLFVNIAIAALMLKD